MRSLTISAILAVTLSACATAPASQYYTAPLDQFTSINIKNDPLDGYVKGDTSDVRLWYRPLAGVKSKVYYRAYAGDDGTDYQIYMITQADDWLYPYQLNFGEPLRKREATGINSDVRCESYGCIHTEHTVISLTEDDVEYLSREDATIEIRLKTQAGQDVDRIVAGNELLALRNRMP